MEQKYYIGRLANGASDITLRESIEVKMEVFDAISMMNNLQKEPNGSLTIRFSNGKVTDVEVVAKRQYAGESEGQGNS